MNNYQWRSGATVIASGYALKAFVPRPDELLAALRHPHVWMATVGPDAAASTLSCAMLWLIALWLSFGMLVTLVALAPGRLGRLAHSLASRVTPAVLRRVVIAAAGASVVASPATAFASSLGAAPAPTGASASILMPSVPGPILPTDRPSSTAQPISADGPRSTDQPHSAQAAGSLAATLAPIGYPLDPDPARIAGLSAPPGRQPRRTYQQVTVRPGDSLWSIAAHRLGPASSEEQIRAEWPRWYAVNRSLIGADPDLLLAGAKLRMPQPAYSSEEK